MAVSTVPPAADAESGARVSTAAPGRDHRIALGVIVLVGAFLRFFELSRQGFWLDEASQIRTSRLIDEQGLREVAKRDNVSPLSHWLLWAWDKIAGDGQFAARVPSAVAGIVTILIVYALGRRLYSSTVGLVAAAVLAISPYAIWYSQDARMYSLLLCATAAMLLVFHLAITEPKRVRWWVLLAVVTTIGIYTHQYAALTTAGCAVYLVVAREWRGTIGRRWLAANAVAALAFLPWLLIASANDAGTAGSEKTAALLWLPYSMFSFLFGFSLGPSIRENQELGAVHAVKPDLWWIIPLAFAAAVVLLVALRNALTRGPRRSNLL
ncbi:MAG TPA: glycosyltransferase family 39 protein, partial [Acidimicrobiales bacterium]|nr:glycosyltransferase family 39 protein [Acidimicrobiales bacterium]